MSVVHVCPLSCLPDVVEQCDASHLVSLISDGTPVERPACIAPDRHLVLSMHDIVEPMLGMVPPSEQHVHSFIDFARRWDRGQPMVVHCWAGISRSTAAAYIASCALAPDRDEEELARELRAASPTATPNGRLVAIADDILGRGGRMRSAAQRIGRGAFAYEGVPFSLSIGSSQP